MKSFFLFLAVLLAVTAQAQTVSSINTSVTINGSGFAAGDTVTAEPSGTACTNVTITNANSITADCPNGTTSVVVTAHTGPTPTYSWTPTSFSFSWVVGTAAPTSQTFQQVWLNCHGCPAVLSKPSTATWLSVGNQSWGGPGGLTISYPIGVLPTGLAPGTYTTTISGLSNGGVPASFSVPVTLVVKAATGSHSVNLHWSASLPQGAPPITGFTLFKAPSATGSYALLANMAASSATYTDTSVTPGQNPCYTIQAVNSAGPSANAAPVCFAIP